MTIVYRWRIVMAIRWLTASDYPDGVFWPLYCLSFSLHLLITPLVSVGHCIVCLSLTYSFWLPRWYLLAIVLSVFQFTASDYPVGIFWPLYCLSFSLQLLIIPLVSFGHCIVCLSVYSFRLPRWYLLAIVLFVFHWLTASDYPVGIFWPLYCVLSVFQFAASDYPVGIFWSLYCLSFSLQLLITPLVSFGHCIVCLSVYSFWLKRWYVLVIVLSVFQFIASDYPVGIFWPLYCLSFCLQLLITPLVSFGLCIVSFSLQLLITPLVSFGHCIVCLSFYSFWLTRWYRLAIVLSVFHRLTASDYPVGIFWPLYCLSFSLQSDYPDGIFKLFLQKTRYIRRGSFTCTIHDVGGDDLNDPLNTRFDLGVV
jgi:hypothetical protein